MKKHLSTKSLILTAFTLLFALAVKAQPHKLSPHDTTTATVHGAKITIIYGSPGIKGREVGNQIAPYGKAWRLGADEATIFETSKDITVQGQKLPAGKYTLFAIPTKAEWTFIFNSETGQWGIKRSGEANFDESKNVLKVTAKPIDAEMQERMKFIIDSKGFTFHWDKIAVPVAIK